jgi:hypothetical protein
LLKELTSASTSFLFFASFAMSDIVTQDKYHRSFVIGIMKLLTVTSYSTTRAYRLELFYLKENRILRARIFENSLVFEQVSNFKVGKTYVVVGWLIERNHLIEVIDMS